MLAKLGRLYEAMPKNDGFVHLFHQMYKLRKQCAESLIYGERDRAEMLRGVIFAVDSILRVPDRMVEDGKAAEAELSQRGIENE